MCVRVERGELLSKEIILGIRENSWCRGISWVKGRIQNYNRTSSVQGKFLNTIKNSMVLVEFLSTGGIL